MGALGNPKLQRLSNPGLTGAEPGFGCSALLCSNAHHPSSLWWVHPRARFSAKTQSARNATRGGRAPTPTWNSIFHTHAHRRGHDRSTSGITDSCFDCVAPVGQ